MELANYHHHNIYNNKNRRSISKKRSQQADISSNMKIKDDSTMIKILNNSRGSSSLVCLDHDFVLCEILSRLPGKTLMRFKSVCKRWMSSIQHDPHFRELHYLNHSETARRNTLIMRLFHVNTDAAERGGGYYWVSDHAHTIKSDFNPFQQSDQLFSLNGLVCLVNQSYDGVRIINPCTREETRWIRTTRRTKKRRMKECPEFVFGFDPITKKHKVLCQWTGYSYEVLTVGDKSWRMIGSDQVPPYKLRGPCIYANGAIYWVYVKHRILRVTGEDKRACRIVVFDVGSEKFREIPLPDFIVQHPRRYCDSDKDWHLLEVDGRLAILHRRNENTVQMSRLIYEDDADHSRNYWTEVIITLPFDWVGINMIEVRFENVPGTDQIVVESLESVVKSHPDMEGPYAYTGWGWWGSRSEIRRRRVNMVSTNRKLSTYSHNWKKNTSEKLGSRLITSEAFGKQLCTPFAESLFSVDYN